MTPKNPGVEGMRVQRIQNSELRIKTSNGGVQMQVDHHDIDMDIQYQTEKSSLSIVTRGKKKNPNPTEEII